MIRSCWGSFLTPTYRAKNGITKVILANLTAKEAITLRSRFGVFLSKEINPDDAGGQFDKTRQRIKEIEEKALRKLKAKREKEQDQNCSFCGKLVTEVNRMIASEINKVFICNECIKNCGDLLDE
jgi:ClpX C4-type zinc finger/Sigma-70, region 4